MITISEEKKEFYRQNQKKALQERQTRRKEAIKAGQEKTLNMSFFIDLYKSLGYNGQTIARAAGMTEQTVNWWIRSDDCKYKNLVYLFQKIGIKLCPHLEQKKDKTTAKQEQKEYKILITDIEIDGGHYKEIRSTKYLQNIADSPTARLNFLAQALDDENYTISTLAEKTKIPAYNIYRWFQTDDIRISKLYDVARKTDMVIIWQIRPLTEEEKTIVYKDIDIKDRTK